MRSILDSTVRIFVGLVFIFSGLVKVNDPMGTAIKLKEYFDVFSTDIASVFQYLVPISLDTVGAVSSCSRWYWALHFF